MRTFKTLCSCIVMLAMLIALLPSVVSAKGETELPLFNTLPVNIDEWSRLAVSPDGKLLFSGGYGTYGTNSYLWHLDSGRNKEIEKLRNSDLIGDAVDNAVFSPDGKLLAVSIFGGVRSRIMLFDSQSGNILETIDSPIPGISIPIQFSHDGKFLIAGLGRDRVSVIEMTSRKEVFSIPKKEDIRIIRSHPTINEFALASSDPTDLQIRNTSTGEIIKSLGDTLPPGNCGIFDMNYSPNGKYFVVSSSENCGTLVYDAEKGYQQVASLDHYGDISFTKDSALVVIGNYAYPIEDKFKTSYGLKVKNSDEPLDPKLAFLTPDGKYFISKYDSYYSKGLIVLDASGLSVRLTGIQIEPKSIAVGLNETQALQVTGTYSDGTSKALKAEDIKWTVKDFYIAEVKENILYGLTYGSTTLTAEYGGQKASVQVNVANRPNGLKAVTAEKSVKLSWSGVNEAAEFIGYHLYRRTADGKYGDTPLTDFPSKTTNYIDSNVDSGQQYYYTVKSVYKNNVESAPSNEASPTSKVKQIILQIDNPIMQVNGIDKEIDPGNGTTPVIYKGRTVLPIRALIDELGGQLTWEDSDWKITINLNGNIIELWIDNHKAIVNGNELTLDVAPTIINGRTMLPIRFISDHLGLQLIWDGETQSVELIG